MFGLRINPAGFDLTVEIRSVNAQGVPGNTILGTEHANDITQTRFGPAVIKSVPVTFSPAVPLVLGTPYALVLTGPHGVGYAVHANDGNPCTDGKLFNDPQADGSFSATGGIVENDLVYTLTITT